MDRKEKEMLKRRYSVGLVVLALLFSSYFLKCFASSKISVDSLRKQKFEIGIFYGPTPELTNDEQFRWIKEANIDFIQFIEDAKRKTVISSEKRNLEILNLAYKHGLKYYVRDPRVNGSDEDIKAMVNTYKGHPATAGYYIQDEPGAAALDWPAKTYRKILSLDPAKVPYVNLLPDFVIPNYEKVYVEKWVDKVGEDHLKFLSFDNYPFMIDGSFRETNFNNLDIIRRVGLKYKVKTSSYLQSMGIVGAYRRPNEHELRFSAYSNLAYGIKNLVWFTYNTPVRQPTEKFTSAIIDSLGNKTDLYKPFKKLNGQLKKIGQLLFELDATEVYHTGAISVGMVQLPSDYFWQPINSEGPLIISRFVHRTNGTQYIMVVNKSLSEKKKISFKLDGDINNVQRFSSDSGKLGKIRIKNGLIVDTFLPGEGRLYQYTAINK